MLVEQAAPVKLIFECAIQRNQLPQVPLAFYHQEWQIATGKATLPLQGLPAPVHHRLLLSGVP
jgi:hypothetical protein